MKRIRLAFFRLATRFLRVAHPHSAGDANILAKQDYESLLTARNFPRPVTVTECDDAVRLQFIRRCKCDGVTYVLMLA